VGGVVGKRKRLKNREGRHGQPEVEEEEASTTSLVKSFFFFQQQQQNS
jgi:hypothetical protein